MAIINQSNILNLQPGITAPVVVHMSEGDVGTKLSFKLIDGVNAWTDPGNVVAAVHGRRQDGTQFGPYACTISGDVVSFQTDAAMAGAAGSGIAQIVLTDGNRNTAGSANFAVMVERATFPMGVTYTNDVSVYEAILAYVQTIPAAVTEDYTAKIAAEAATRYAADVGLTNSISSLQDGLSEEVSARTTQDAVLSARMDEFTKLPDGSLSTAADAELVDIRVKANGKTASTAGDAVREQVSELKNDLDDLDETVNGVETRNYVEGKNLTANTALQHAIIDDPNACISDHIPVTWGSNKFGFIYTDDADDTNGYQVWFFDSSNNFLNYYGRASGEVYRRNLVCPENTTYIIISFKRGFAGVVTDNNLNPVYYTAATEITNPGLVQKIGDLSDLETENKTSLVSAINEIHGDVENYESAFETGDVTDTYEYADGDLEWTDGVKYYTGAHYTGGSYDSYHFCYFDVQEGDVISTGTGVFRDRCEFNGETVVSTTNITGFSSYTVPAGVNRIALTRYKTNVTDITIQRTHSVTLVSEDALRNAVDAIKNSTDLLDDLVINVPSKIYALPGLELNVYFDNIVEDANKYDWNITCAKGIQLERGYRITPSAGDTGTYPVIIKASEGKSSKSVSSNLIIANSNAGGGETVSIIILGDSTTYNGYAVEKLHENFNGDVMSIVTNGTMGTAPNNHEGRSGWSLNDYFTKASITYPAGDPRGTIYNPFYNPSTETFDATYYFNNSGVPVPDWFIINMGINDMFSFTTDTGLSAQITKCIDYLNAMINSIHSVSAVIKIGICVTIPPNHSQDAFGKAYGCGQTRDRYKHNNTLWANAVIDEFTGRESDGVYLVPIHTNLDTIYNMGMETIPVNSRNTETYQSPIGNGGVHPSIPGYWQVADVYTAFLKAQA